MLFKTGVDKKMLKHHFAYHAWQYLLILVLSFGLWSLIYQTTKHRPAEDAKIDVYIQSSAANQEAVNAFLEPIWRDAVPNEELVSAVLLLAPAGGDDYYANMQLVTYISVGAGDIYMLSSADFKRFAAQGAFVALDDQIRDGILEVTDLDLSMGRVTPVSYNDLGEMVPESYSSQFGVPAAGLGRFFSELSIDNRDMVLAVAYNSGNVEDSIVFLDALIKATRVPESDALK